MATDPEGSAILCETCDEVFEHREELEAHMEDAHGTTPERDEEDAAAAGSDASGSTGSISEETNDSPSATEPAEAADPSGNDDDVRPNTDRE